MIFRFWAVRTVKAGAVKVGGQHYYPDPLFMIYDGRLDGQRFIFGRYRDGDGYLPLLYLWGTEEASRSIQDDAKSLAFWNTGPHIVEGASPWCWWRTEAELLRRKANREQEGNG